MRRRAAFLFLFLFFVAVLTASTSARAAEEGRFDAQAFRPLPGPRDLVMVPKSEVIGHLSPTTGVYWDAAVHPLAFRLGDTGKTLNAVGSRLTITPLIGVGLFDWVELTMAVPFITWQTSDNLRRIGSEGRIQSTPGLGDVRVSTKIAIPYFNRKIDVSSGFGAPAVRVFNSITWQPKSSAEQHEVNKVLDRSAADPDHDGIIEPADKCPNVAGSPQNDGCPDQDRDGDGVSDHEDKCPDLAAGPDGGNGCPAARVLGDLLATFEPITFQPGSADLSTRATVILESVVQLLHENESIREIEVQAHTDARESDGRTENLSHKRAKRIARWLLHAGVEEERISARGYGHSLPEVDDSDCVAPDELAPFGCEAATKTNRRVVLRIMRWGARPSTAILGDQPASVLPIVRAGEASKDPPFPSCRPWTKGGEKAIPCVLPMKPAVLTQTRVLQNAKDAEGRLPPGKTRSLPTGGVLPKGGGPLPSPP